ncbi:FkbM family methyltransferase [Pseudoxanthomonas winnipegensis]|jgi:FkbM family methyltransferase|uniref:FkbM family methyltransferase n=1 Tax=Pseudoxanthomonas winnipegensis TaxID=2480810 RepID=A0A4Q8LHL7_9GAMM|nr:FkbM family methyltransferase [Pseudoxanthomonas winnipegensis]TAA28764.1 FkbM family methyltransferase [Pseudoxanthomonas winnipegensis]TAA44528.1 FkbM family methyltransferase [Pseudoxanthomonas winnipegensis]
MSFISYAQNFEDVMLRRALRHIEVGFYVDVGAQHPEIDSITKAFYEQGWRGINIEPVSDWYRALQEQRPRDINLNVAAGSSAGTVVITEIEGTGLSTAVESLAEAHVQLGFQSKEIRVPVQTVTSICEQYHLSPIHFMKVDVEGFEEEVIRGIDFTQVRPWILVVEATLPNSEIASFAGWEPILVAAGYRFVYFDGLNRFYVAEEHAELTGAFAMPPNNFDDFVLSGTASQPFCQLLNAKVAEREGQVASLASRADELSQRATSLEAALASERERADMAGAEAEQHRLKVTLLEVENRLVAEHLHESERRFESVAGGLRELTQELQVLRGEVEGVKSGASQDRWSDAVVGVVGQFHAATSDLIRRELDEFVRWQEQLKAVEIALSQSQSELASVRSDQRRIASERRAALTRVVELEGRLAEVLESNHGWFIRAGQMEREVEKMTASKSWRLTAPLRWSRRVPARMLQSVKRAPWRAVALLRRNPRLWVRASSVIRRWPRLFARFRSAAEARGMLSEPLAISSTIAPSRVVSAGRAAIADSGSSERQRRVEAQLKSRNR